MVYLLNKYTQFMTIIVNYAVQKQLLQKTVKQLGTVKATKPLKLNNQSKNFVNKTTPFQGSIF